MEPSAKRARRDMLPPDVWARIREFVPRDRVACSPTAAAVRGFLCSFEFSLESEPEGFGRLQEHHFAMEHLGRVGFKLNYGISKLDAIPVLQQCIARAVARFERRTRLRFNIPALRYEYRLKPECVNCRHHPRPQYIASLSALPRCAIPSMCRVFGVYRDDEFD